MPASILLRRLYCRWKNIHLAGYIGVAVLLSVLFTIPLAAFIDLAGISDAEMGSPDFIKEGLAAQFVLGVIAAPLLETWLCQQLPVQIVQHLTKRRSYSLSLITSALIFAAMHAGYSIWYSIIVFPMGLLLAETYLVFQQRKASAYWVTVAVHALRNLLAFAAGIFG